MRKLAPFIPNNLSANPPKIYPAQTVSGPLLNYLNDSIGPGIILGVLITPLLGILTYQFSEKPSYFSRLILSAILGFFSSSALRMWAYNLSIENAFVNKNNLEPIIMSTATIIAISTLLSPMVNLLIKQTCKKKLVSSYAKSTKRVPVIPE